MMHMLVVWVFRLVASTDEIQQPFKLTVQTEKPKTQRKKGKAEAAKDDRGKRRKEDKVRTANNTTSLAEER